MPPDFTFLDAVAIALIAVCWFGYSYALNLIGSGSLNSQLSTVREHWVRAMTNRVIRPFDAILIGHITNAIAFFGSATLLVLAGTISVFTIIADVHQIVSRIGFVQRVSLELFEMKIALVALVLAICFFSFTYSLRKLVYLIALLGALPHTDDACPTTPRMVEATATVMTEAIRTFNLGIRGYYYAIAALCLIASPLASIAATVIVTFALFYRQLSTSTSRAIADYVDAAQSIPAAPRRPTGKSELPSDV
ncbi:MAG: DUF599 family protein [Pseudomonadota bacterium]